MTLRTVSDFDKDNFIMRMTMKRLDKYGFYIDTNMIAALNKSGSAFEKSYTFTFGK